MTNIASNVLASVDLGSNSFRLQICENHNGQLKIIDSFKQMVRFAAGLDNQKHLSEESQERALECLAKFGERLKGFSPEQVRVVATNTFRVAKNIGTFIPKAEAALGFPIEVIAGREEARLIYTGVVHTLPPNGDKMLVIDIGGGSTEFVIGSDLQPTLTESLPLGCVTYSMRFFQSKISQKDFQAAITAARNEIQRISKLMKRNGWDFAVGTSGSAKSIRDVLAAENPQEADITYAGMKKIADKIISAGGTRKAKLEGLKPDRVEVFAGGLAVMMAAFEELEIQKMMVTNAALRDGVFYDFIGRQLNEDMRDQTTAEFQLRYHVSRNQAKRISETAQKFMESLCLAHNTPVQELAYWQQYINWAGLLHEIGINIAHTGYHKHSAYILENADMPGFSRKEQNILSLLVFGHRGDLRKMVDLVGNDHMMWFAILSLRLAALFCRSRLPLELPQFTQLRSNDNGKAFTLRISQNWLDEHPLIDGALEYESEQWQKINMPFNVQPQ
ncbi:MULTISPECIES: exopolyphosphatase [unclassified Neisseria]|uniref:exopolyphosphatase n=1 Tax=unclassified Neisseria TaxID=2623750 RepID=UPI0026657298|nr:MULTISPECIES: exopolyphosphatase [unclassified Neisseria]MDO1508946.1 exopolyphosphatase [Neisseria sp. MVDL19-042950]MDO1515205.1 exopolyphosphatase [Neisseria sp. MVDL18-041461]MDO1562565.1 exopolyphosphatase [Neisseria sp. MVDL20-010259]